MVIATSIIAHGANAPRPLYRRPRRQTETRLTLPGTLGHMSGVHCDHRSAATAQLQHARESEPQQLDQAARIDGLGEVIVEARGEGALLVDILAPAGDGDEPGGEAGGGLPHFARDFVPRESGHADVEQDYFGLDVTE